MFNIINHNQNCLFLTQNLQDQHYKPCLTSFYKLFILINFYHNPQVYIFYPSKCELNYLSSRFNIRIMCPICKLALLLFTIIRRNLLAGINVPSCMHESTLNIIWLTNSVTCPSWIKGLQRTPSITISITHYPFSAYCWHEKLSYAEFNWCNKQITPHKIIRPSLFLLILFYSFFLCQKINVLAFW